MTVKSVLLVNDDEDFLVKAIKTLSNDFKVAVIGISISGSDALDKIKSINPDLVLMDLTAVEINGLEAAKVIKNFSNPPVIFITSYFDNKDYRNLAALAGADGYLQETELSSMLMPLVSSIKRNKLNPDDQMYLSRN